MELALDSLHLFAEEVLPLVSVDLFLHLLLDAALGLDQLELGVEEGEDPFQPFGDGGKLEDPLLVLELKVHVEGDVVGELGRVLEVLDELGDVGGKVLALLKELGKALLDLPVEGLDLDGVSGLVPHRFDFGLQVALGFGEPAHPGPGEALDQHLHRAVRVFAHPQDVAEGAGGKEVVGPRFLGLLVALGNDQHHPVALERGVNGGDAQLPAGVDRHHHGGVDDRPPHRDDRDLFGDVHGFPPFN